MGYRLRSKFEPLAHHVITTTSTLQGVYCACGTAVFGCAHPCYHVFLILPGRQTIKRVTRTTWTRSKFVATLPNLTRRLLHGLQPFARKNKRISRTLSDNPSQRMTWESTTTSAIVQKYAKENSPGTQFHVRSFCASISKQKGKKRDKV